MTPLLPLPDHLGHSLHSPPPLIQAALERPLPQFTLDLLAHTRALDAQSVFGPLALDFGGGLRRPGEQREDVVGLGQFYQGGLAAEGVGWRLPAVCEGVFKGEERIWCRVGVC